MSAAQPIPRANAPTAPLGAALAVVLAMFPRIAAASGDGATGHGAGATLGELLPLWSVVPFAGLLLSIALLPMVAGHFWHATRNQFAVAMGWAAPVLAGLLWLAATDHGSVGVEAAHALAHAVEEYVAFIALLGSLYVISGGIVLRGDLEGKPHINVAFLAVGAVLSNLIGTTGASMLLIRPLLRTNSERRNTWHIPVFFIFLVSNVGGVLTPIGDPPLFLGYLRGVPFTWTLLHLWPAWLLVCSAVLVVFYALDSRSYAREELARREEDRLRVEPLRLDGRINFLLLAGVVGSVLLLSPDPTSPDLRQYYLREVAMAILAALSMGLTPRALRATNRFSWTPIFEVAALFAGIFLAMIPATTLLQARGHELGLTEPWQYFWATGALSAFLDNAPTYAAFAAMACGVYDHCLTAADLGPLTTQPDSAAVLAAVSMGAVFLGAGSYIGNGPNFMVRAIAEESGYAMPSFFGYSAMAAVVLGPILLLVTLLWLV